MNNPTDATANPAVRKSDLTVRGLIHELVNVEDQDGVAMVSFFGSDPVPVTDVEVTEEGVTITGSVA